MKRVKEKRVNFDFNCTLHPTFAAVTLTNDVTGHICNPMWEGNQYIIIRAKKSCTHYVLAELTYLNTL